MSAMYAQAVDPTDGANTPRAAPVPPTEWFLATAATDHIANNIRDLCNVMPAPASAAIFQVDGARVPARAKGTAYIDTGRGGGDRVSAGLTLVDVLYVPSFRSSLISVGRLCRAGFSVEFNGGVVVRDGAGATVMTGTWVEGGYRVDRN